MLLNHLETFVVSMAEDWGGRSCYINLAIDS